MQSITSAGTREKEPRSIGNSSVNKKAALKAVGLADETTWLASLELGFERRDQVCRLVRNQHRGPLCVQKPFYPEGKDLAHVYLLHPPGGMVSGDQLNIDITVGRDASALITTPGAGKVYRARTDRQLQQQAITINLAAAATLEWLPQETIIYPGACTSLETRIRLDAGSHFIGWEITSLGLPASGLSFNEGELRQLFSISQGNTPVLHESLLLSPANSNLYESCAGMQNQPINGFFVAGSICALRAETLKELNDALKTVLQHKLAECSGEPLAGVSQVGNFIIARYLGQSSEEAKALFIALWQILRPILIGRQVSQPGIWLT